MIRNASPQPASFVRRAIITMIMRINIPSEQIAALCRRNHIRRLALFGSVLLDDFTPESDVDVLVEFEPGCTPGFGFIRVEDELSAVLGRKVDLNTPNNLSKYFRDSVLSVAEDIFVAA